METKPLPQRRANLRGWLFVGFMVLIIAALMPVVAGWGRQTARSAQARAEVVQLTAAFRGYYEAYGVIPVGSSYQIMAALNGNNLRKIAFFQSPPTRFGPKGELVDPWHNPYLVDLTDPAHPKAYSFGPNMRDDHAAPGSDDITSW